MASSLLTHLNAMSVTVTVQDGSLKVQAPVGSLTPELHASIIAKKSELIELLSRATAEGASSNPRRPAVPEDRKIYKVYQTPKGPLELTEEEFFRVVEVVRNLDRIKSRLDG